MCVFVLLAVRVCAVRVCVCVCCLLCVCVMCVSALCVLCCVCVCARRRQSEQRVPLSADEVQQWSSDQILQ